MHIHCPHCHSPIEVVEDQELRDVVCPSCGSSFNLLPDETVTRFAGERRTLGHFELIERIGVGAFGEVWTAHDTELDRTVAIKLPRKGQLTVEEAESFLREARSAASLNHPGIVTVHEVGKAGDQLFIVSDYVRGVTLADWLSGKRPTSIQAATLVATLADAVQHAHEHGVIHRDLKPSNIMLDDREEPHVMDFGLAKREAGEITMTVDGKVLGTPAYMSPEQARGAAHDADARSDVYSLGVILFELLTGELPFRGNPRMLVHQVINEEPPSPRRLNGAVSQDLETIVLRCLEKDPGKRYAVASDLADDLRHFLAGEPIDARPITRAERGWRWARRNPVVASLTATVAGLLLLIAVGTTLAAWHQTQLLRGVQRQNYMLQMNEDFHAWYSGKSDGSKTGLTDPHKESGRETDAGLETRLLQALCDGDRPESVWNLDVQVTSLAFSADNRLLAAGLVDGTVAVGGVGATEPTSILSTGPNEVTHCIAFSPDGQFLVAGRGRADSLGEVLLWQVPTEPQGQFKESRRLIEHDAPVGAVVINGEAGALTGVSVDFRGVVKRWSLSSGEEICETRIPCEKATQVALSADGRTVALGWKGKVVVYDVDGELRGDMNWDVYEDSPLALSADGNFLAVGWEFHMRLVDLNAQPPWEGERLSRYRCRSLSFSRDGTILAGGGDGSRPFSLWDMRTKRPVGRFVQHGMVACVAISPDGCWLASADTGRSVLFWDLTKLKRNVFLTDQFAYKLLALSPDNKTVALGGPDQTLVLWNTETGMTRRFGEHAGRVTDLEFSRDGKLLASSSADRWVRIWDVASGECIDRHDRHQDEAWSVAFASADSSKLISGGKQGELWWWDRTSGLKKRIPGHRQDVAVWWIKATSEFHFLVSGSIWPTSGDTNDNEAIVWELKTDGPVKLGESLPTLGVCSIAFDQKEHYFAMGTSAPTVAIRRFHDRGLEQSLDGGNPWVTGVTFSPQEDDDCVLTAGASGEIRIFRNWSEAENAEPVAVIRTDDQFRTIEFFPDGHAFVTAGMDGYIRVWRTPRNPNGEAD